MDVIIVVHTEFGFVHAKEVIPDKNATEGVSKGVPNLIKVADKHGAKVTFVVMPEVVDAFPKGINHEVGLHIHSGWEEFRQSGFTFHVGDRYLREHCHQSSNSTVLRGYPYEEQLDMIQTGADCISDSLGVRPTTFVAGRWSIDNNTVKALITGRDGSGTARPLPIRGPAIMTGQSCRVSACRIIPASVITRRRGSPSPDYPDLSDVPCRKCESRSCS